MEKNGISQQNSILEENCISQQNCILEEISQQYYTFEELLEQNNECSIEYNINEYLYPIKKSSRIRIQLNTSNLNNITIMSNPVLVFEIDDSLDLEFDLNNLFCDISLEIGGARIDKLFDKQILIYNKIYGLETKKIDSKIFYPIPFGCMNNGQGLIISNLTWHFVNIFISFENYEFINMIKNLSIKTKLSRYLYKPGFFDTINNYYKKILFEDYYSHYNKSIDFINENIFNGKSDFARIKINQYCVCNAFTSSTFIYNLGFNYFTERFFIYFQNSFDKSIYWNTQLFKKIEIIIDGYVVKKFCYEDLQYANTKENLGYELPKGVFEIKWDSFDLHENLHENLYEDFKKKCKNIKNLSRIDKLCIKIHESMIPPHINFGICSESINYLRYSGGMCGTMFSH